MPHDCADVEDGFESPSCLWHCPILMHVRQFDGGNAVLVDKFGGECVILGSLFRNIDILKSLKCEQSLLIGLAAMLLRTGAHHITGWFALDYGLEHFFIVGHQLS